MKGTHHQGAHHVVDPKVYIRTLVLLLILMAATVGVALIPYEPLHETVWGSYVANGLNLGIAIIKGLLVISFFMGVKKASDLVKLWAMLGFIWFTLMFIILNDYGTRRFEPVQSWDRNDAGSGMQRNMDARGSDEKGPMMHTRP